MPGLQASSAGTQVDYDIRAPEGGLRTALEAFLPRDPHTEPTGLYIDVTVSLRRGHTRVVRIYPARLMSRWGKEMPDVFFFDEGDCVLLGNEAGPTWSCSGRINTQVTNPTETGKLGILFPDETEII